MRNRNILLDSVIHAGHHVSEGDYWKKKLSGNLVRSVFPFDPGQTIQGKKGLRAEKVMETFTFTFPTELFSRLMKLANKSDARVNMILIAGVVVLLDKYTNNRDIIVGTPVYKQDTEGKFVNTVLALRNWVEPTLPFKNLLLQVRQTMNEAIENQNYPMEALLHQLGIPFHETDDFPLFDVAILLENIHDRKYLQHLRLNIIFSFRKTNESLEAVIQYNSSFYGGALIERLGVHFLRLMEQALYHVDVKVSQIDILTREEKRQQLVEFNRTGTEYPRDMTIQALFQEHVKRSPHHAAVVHGVQQVTYGALNQGVNQLARRLRKRGVVPDTIVGVMMDRSIEMVVSLLAVLNAGGAYLPIDPELPGYRILHMLEDCQAPIVLTKERIIKKQSFTGLQGLQGSGVKTHGTVPPGESPQVFSRHLVMVDRLDVTRESGDNLENTNHPSDLAYTIFTSGSTGNPKGVLIRHRSVVNLVMGLEQKIYNINGTKPVHVSLISPYVFDASIKQIFASLLLGHTLVIVPEEARLDGEKLLRFYKEKDIQVADGTPAHLAIIVNEEKELSNHLPVQRWLIGGDELDFNLAGRLMEIVNINQEDFHLVNVYGPTECCDVITLYYVPAKTIKEWQRIPIGKPLPNIRVYILGNHNELQVVGVPGELCAAGDDLGRGYLNNPELTAERFIRAVISHSSLVISSPSKLYTNDRSQKFFPNDQCPMTNDRSCKLYKTGDLARWLADGNIEFLGRIDHQVKIRGYRIELEEIENQLTKHDKIKEAVVTMGRKATGLPGDGYLCAYIAAGNAEHGAWSAVELREYLSQTLPDYMIPAYFMHIEKIPLTPNGKIDRKALPPPEIKPEELYKAPRDRFEEKLVDIWAEVLELDKEMLSISANFFELGGHSLTAVTLINRIHEAFQTRIPLLEIFRTPTIEGISQIILKSAKEVFCPIEAAEKKEYYPLSSAQKRLYVLGQVEEGGTGYHVPQAAVLEGLLEREVLEACFRRLLQRHESLRTSFQMIKDQPVQKIHPEVEFAILQSPVSTLHASTMKDFVRPFDLSEAPLLRVRLAAIDKQQHILMMDMHHIVTDGISMDIMVKEFMAIYAGSALPPLRLQYKDYSQWQNHEHQQETHKSQEVYWLSRFEGEIPVLNLPLDFPRPLVQRFQGRLLHFEVPVPQTQELNQLALNRGATLYMVLLAVYTVLLSKLSGQEDIVVGTPIAGRRHADLEKIIGMFVNTLVMRNYPEGNQTFAGFLEELKTSTLEAFENQEYQFEDLVERVVLHRDASRNPLFDVLFALQNEEVPRVEIPGLKLKPYEWDIQTSVFDLALQAYEAEQQLVFSIEYHTQLFKEDTIRRWIEYYKRIIEAVIREPGKKISRIEIISAEEKKQVLFDFNDTAAAYPVSQTIDALFREQLRQFPEQAAVTSYMNMNLTGIYEQLTSGTMDRQLPKHFENCCFKKNPYIFRYKGLHCLEALNIFTDEESKTLVLLRTHRMNYVAVNPPVLHLLDCFDGKTNTRSIFKGISTTGRQFLIYPIKKEGNETDFYPGTPERVVLSESIDGMVVLVKALEQAHLIELTGYNPVDAKISPVWDDEGVEVLVEEAEVPVVKAVKGKADGVRSPVLLLGDRTGQASTGLLYIASFLRRKGIEAYCRWSDTNNTRGLLKNDTEHLLSTIQPRVVGVSMKWFPHIARVLEICRMVKNFDPSIQVVVGGNTASYYHEKIITYDCIDYVIVGDGEVPMLKLFQGEKEDQIPNLVYICSKTGEIIKNPVNYVQNENNTSEIYLSHLDDIFVSKKDPYLVFNFFINTGKGCSMQCFYCAGCREVQKQSFNRDKPFLRGVTEVHRDIMAVREYTSTLMFDFDLSLYDSLDYYRLLWEGLDLSGHFCKFYFWQLPAGEFLDYVTATFKYVYINIDLCSLSQPHRMKLTSLGVVKPQPTDEALFAFFDRCERYDNIEVYIGQVAGLPYFSAEDIKRSEETLSRLLNYRCFRSMDWGQLHAQPGAPIAAASQQYDMHSYATTFEDFLHYSQLNWEEESYPQLLTFHYPYIYSNDDDLNSKITKFYIDSTAMVLDREKERESGRLIHSTHTYTYAQLEERAARLAKVLKEKGVKPEIVVGVMAEQSPEMIAAILAVLKAGGVYLPIDYNYPKERIEYMLADSQAAFLLTHSHRFNRFEKIHFEGQVLDLFDRSLYHSRASKIKPVPPPIAGNAAYIMYTSGSAGKPRGVVVEQGNVVRLVKNSNYIRWSKGDRLLLTGNIVFDITTFEIWGPLLNGLNLFLADQEMILDGEKLKDILWKNKINILHLVPQVLDQLASTREGLDIFAHLDYFLVGGDLVKPLYINQLRERFPNLEILHMYGPTENTTFSTYYPVNHPVNHKIPIGKAIGNSMAYVVDKYDQLQPVGVVGELVVAGAGVARGYLNNPELTAEKFDHDKKNKSFCGGPGGGFFKKSPLAAGGKIYKTGDQARWLPSGDLEFLGRQDLQVKIRGMRIEPGEIESRLMNHKAVKEAVVTVRDDAFTGTYLCAYIVLVGARTAETNAPPGLNTGELKRYLSQTLPDYMIPGFFVQLERVPLTANGKVNRKALPAPEINARKKYVAPGNPLEQKLVDIWYEVLGIDVNTIGVEDNFFELGGHSLKAVIMLSKIHKKLQVKIPLVELFKISTISGLASYIREAGEAPYTVFELVEKREYYTLSSAQKRVYVIQQMDPGSTAYNMFLMIPIMDYPDIEKIQRSFRQLIHHQESFRTSFQLIEENPVQRVHDEVKFEVEYLIHETHEKQEKISSLPTANRQPAIISDFLRPFDLSRAPLLRVGVMKQEKENFLLVNLHHIIGDGVSGDIMVKNFMSLYEGAALPPLHVQYKDFSEWQNRNKEKENLKQQETYWLGQFDGEIPVLSLPTDYARPAKLSFEGSFAEFTLGPGETSALNGIARDANATLFIVIFALYNIFLAKLSGQEDIVIGTVIAGRRYEDLQHIVGMFANIMAMRSYPKAEKIFSEFLAEVREYTLEAFDNQDYQFEDLVERLAVKRDPSRHPLIDVAVVLQNIIAGSTPVQQDEKKTAEYYENKTSKYDMTLVGHEIHDQLHFLFNYSTQLFKPETMERFIDYFKRIVTEVTSHPYIPLSGIEIISEKEKKQILFDFNNTRVDYPETKTIHQLFAEQVKKTPGDIALKGAVDLTDIYRELETETFDPGMFTQLESCCFKRNKYIFACDLSQFDETNTFMLLKTCQHNIMVVNRNVLQLIEFFDGEKNLASIYALLRSRDLHLEFLIYSINIDDVLEISFSSKKKEEWVINNKFEDFIPVVKSLYNKNILQLVKMNPGVVEWNLDMPAHEYFDLVDAVKNNAVLEGLMSHKKNLTRADILLLGDTPGQSTAGLLYLASYLRRNGIKAYCDFNDSNREISRLKKNIEELLEKIKPRIVGISMKWFLHIARVLEMCKIVKGYSRRNSLDIRVVLGGNSASLFWENIIKDDNVDYIIRGDGELPFLKLCRGEQPIPNCVYKENGKIVENPITYIQDGNDSSDIYLSHMDEIMLSDYSCLFGMFFVFTQKGCRKNCHYCGGCNDAQRITFSRPGLFWRNVEEVRKDIIESKKYTSTFYFLFDDYSNERMLEYCHRIWDGIDLTGHFGSISNVIPPSPELIEYSRRVFKYVYWNLDMASMSERHRKQLFAEGMVKFQPTDREVLHMFVECEKYDNSEILINIITGLPYFNYEDIRESKRILTYIMNNYTCFGEFYWARLHAEPCAPVIRDADKYNMYSLAKTFEDFLEHSGKNLTQFDFYPNVDTFIYPYIYFKDEEMNSAVSRYYAETTSQWEKYRRDKLKKTIIYNQLSYRDLDREAGLLAMELKKKGVKSDTVVGIMMERSPEMIVGLLGILKAGAAYLPLDPQYPADRLKYMMDDCHITLLVSKAYLENQVEFGGDFIDLELTGSPAGEDSIREPGTDDGDNGQAADMAYVIYTSGSTGKPKGVAVEHRAIINTLAWRKHYYQFSPRDVVLQIPSFSFDSSVEDIFTPLTSGSRLVLVPNRHRLDLEYLKRIIEKNRVTHFLIVPGLYKTFLEGIYQGLDQVKTITVAGENFTEELVHEHFEKLPGVRLFNEYGPTENSVCTTVYEFSPDKTNILIGHPIHNVQCYILDKNNGINPVGVPGELWVSGKGVARGYLNNPKLTAEKFLPVCPRSHKPYGTYISKKIYRTGDLTRWVWGGNIEFLGRIDQQIKIRGFRVELGEIENQLRSHDDVKDTVVITREYARGDNYLCAYVISPKEMDALKLREYLLGKLPDYMVPAYFVRVDSIPLTPNGKINRKALPDPQVKPGSDYMAPRSRLESTLVEIWSEVLGRPGDAPVGINDNFFDLGGHSLKAITLLSKIHKELNVSISLLELFKTPTIEGLSGAICAAPEHRYTSITRAANKEHYALSSAQKGLYILQQLDETGTGYNLANLILLEDAFDIERMEETFKKLIQRHEMLRTAFVAVEREPMQKIHPEVDFAIERYECEEKEVESMFQCFVRPFDLSQPPLLRVGYLKVEETDQMLMVDMHHIISDAVSHDLLVKEFMAIYNGRELPQLTLQYKDYSEWQHNLLSGAGGAIHRQERFWLEQFEDQIPVLNLPTDFPRPEIKTYMGKQINFHIHHDLTAKVRRLVNQTGTTLNMILLAVYYILLSRYTNQEDIVVGSPVVGRPHEDLQNIIGLFVNMLPLRSQPGSEKTFREFLLEVKDRVIQSVENQDYPFEQMVIKLGLQGSTNRNPLFDVVFMMANAEDQVENSGNSGPVGKDQQHNGQEDFKSTSAVFDIILTAVAYPEAIEMVLQFSTNLFKEERIKKFTGHYIYILQQVVEDMDIQLKDIAISHRLMVADDNIFEMDREEFEF